MINMVYFKITFFAYMYFTSSTWSLVGCLVAGFGVYPLLQPCINPSLSDDVLSNKYAERPGALKLFLPLQIFIFIVYMIYMLHKHNTVYTKIVRICRGWRRSPWRWPCRWPWTSC